MKDVANSLHNYKASTWNSKADIHGSRNMQIQEIEYFLKYIDFFLHKLL